jgi:hypothetical protein
MPLVSMSMLTVTDRQELLRSPATFVWRDQPAPAHVSGFAWARAALSQSHEIIRELFAQVVLPTHVSMPIVSTAPSSSTSARMLNIPPRSYSSSSPTRSCNSISLSDSPPLRPLFAVTPPLFTELDSAGAVGKPPLPARSPKLQPHAYPSSMASQVGVAPRGGGSHHAVESLPSMPALVVPGHPNVFDYGVTSISAKGSAGTTDSVSVDTPGATTGVQLHVVAHSAGHLSDTAQALSPLLTATGCMLPRSSEAPSQLVLNADGSSPVWSPAQSPSASTELLAHGASSSSTTLSPSRPSLGTLPMSPTLRPSHPLFAAMSVRIQTHFTPFAFWQHSAV